MRETFTFDRADRVSDILNGVAAAVGGLIEYEWLACASWSLSIAAGRRMASPPAPVKDPDGDALWRGPKSNGCS